MVYLGSINPPAATKNNIAKNANIRAQEGSDFANLMSELVSIVWVEKRQPETVNGYEYYIMTEKGRKALNEAKDFDLDPCFWYHFLHLFPNNHVSHLFPTSILPINSSGVRYPRAEWILSLL